MVTSLGVLFGACAAEFGPAAPLISNEIDFGGVEDIVEDSEEQVGIPCVEGDTRVLAADGTCYFTINTVTNWATARASCQNLGADLATLESAAENQLVWTIADAARTATQPDYWVGATDAAVEQSWVWVDGTPMIYENWRLGEPNDGGTTGVEDCMVLEADNPAREWDDRSCTTGSRPYVCERPPAQ